MPSISSLEMNNHFKNGRVNVVDNPYSDAPRPQGCLSARRGIEAAGPLSAALKHCRQGNTDGELLQRRIVSLVNHNYYSDNTEHASDSFQPQLTTQLDKRSFTRPWADHDAALHYAPLPQDKNGPAAGLNLDVPQTIKNYLNKRTKDRQKVKSIIPKIIHYIWLGNPAKLHKILLRNIINSAVLNPDYKVKLWVDSPEKMRTYLIDAGYSTVLFKKITLLSLCLPADVASVVVRECTNTRYKNYAAASDIIRLSVLKDNGGIYMDVDVALQRPLGHLLPCRAGNGTTRETLFHIEYRVTTKSDTLPYVLSNGVIACAKGSKDIQDLMERALAHYDTIKYGWGGRSNRVFDLLLRNSCFWPAARPFFIRIMHLVLPGFTQYIKAKDAEDFIWCKKRTVRSQRLEGTLRTTGPVMISKYLVEKYGYLFDRYKNFNLDGEDVLSSMVLQNAEDFGQIKRVYQHDIRLNTYDAKRLYNITMIFGQWVSGLDDSAGWLTTDNTLNAAEI